MPTFEQGETVKVPFPYADRATRQRRPALVVSAGGLGEHGDRLWVMMITSAENRPWPGDRALAASQGASGLDAPSLVQTCKIATIEARHAQVIGETASLGPPRRPAARAARRNRPFLP
ncbi:MAG: type II toxin-antitoxin system PemK/MazF family toxin [Caulobacteraceae bacterium]